jgi:hypothetical protein
MRINVENYRTALKRHADKMTSDFPTAPSTYGLKGPSAAVTVEKSPHASHTEILTLPLPRAVHLPRFRLLDSVGMALRPL